MPTTLLPTRPMNFQTFLRSCFYNAFRYLGNKNVFPCRNFWHDKHVPFYHQLNNYDLGFIIVQVIYVITNYFSYDKILLEF